MNNKQLFEKYGITKFFTNAGIRISLLAFVVSWPLLIVYFFSEMIGKKWSFLLTIAIISFSISVISLLGSYILFHKLRNWQIAFIKDKKITTKTQLKDFIESKRKKYKEIKMQTNEDLISNYEPLFAEENGTLHLWQSLYILDKEETIATDFLFNSHMSFLEYLLDILE